MTDRIVNPFQNIDIFVPRDHHADLVLYSQRVTGDAPDYCPFRRMVDFWFLSVCVGVRKGFQPVSLGPKPIKIIDGAILGADGWRINLLMLVAIGRKRDVSIVLEPREIIQLASGLAAASIPTVVDMLNEGDAEPIWNLSDSVEKLFGVGRQRR